MSKPADEGAASERPSERPSERLMVRYACLETTEDDFAEGEAGFPHCVWEESWKGPFDGWAKLLEYLRTTIGAPDNAANWGGVEGEPGRLEADWTVNAENLEPTPQELKAWKRGKCKLYTARLSVYVVAVQPRDLAEGEVTRGLQESRR